MEYRSQEIKAGLVVFFALVLFFSFLFAVTKSGIEEKAKQYTARFSYTSGIQPGSQVRLGGMPVGRVKKVYFPSDNASQIEVLLEVRQDAPIRDDSEAFITSIGLMGEYYVEITIGKPMSPLLPSGSELRSKDIPQLSQMGEPLQNLSDRLEVLLVRAAELLNAKNQEHLANIIASVDTVMQSSQQSLPEMTRRFSALSLEFQKLAATMNGMLEENSDSINQALGRLNESMLKADSLMAALAQTSDQVNYFLVSNEEGLQTVLYHLQEASKNFEEFSLQIKYQPWTLIRKSSPPARKISK